MNNDTINICACDKYDKKERKCDYYLGIQGEPDVLYTDNPIKEIHDRLPTTVIISTLDFEVEMLALYINCLISEGYNIFYEVEDDSIWGLTVSFKITEEEKQRMKQELERKKAETKEKDDDDE